MPGESSRAPALPDEDEVWRRVRHFAAERVVSGEPVPTLQECVGNTIVGVQDTHLSRRSARTRTGAASDIPAAEFKRTWRELVATRRVHTKGRTVFTPALLQAAMPELIDDLGGGWIGLHGEPSVEVDYPATASAGARPRPRRSTGSTGGWGGSDDAPRESDEHWALKHYIHRHPSRALAELEGGPFLASALELRLPTHDCIDVVVRDGEHRRVLIEVKPYVGEDDRRWYAQAAKYRTIWRVLHDKVPAKHIRCVLTAPKIAPKLAAKMWSEHGIESLAVEVPKSFEAPPRP